jgi:hypothetical protein
MWRCGLPFGDGTPPCRCVMQDQRPGRWASGCCRDWLASAVWRLVERRGQAAPGCLYSDKESLASGLFRSLLLIFLLLLLAPLACRARRCDCS